jgi:dihydroorotate dehydrogenase (fumarate)
MKSLTITPPLLNSSNPWCTTLEQLQELYDCHHTGAVTTRTSLLNGFPHDSSHHQFTFFNPKDLTSSTPNQDCGGTSSQTGSLNTLGYSPTPLREYLSYISAISSNLGVSAWLKPFIISVTGSSEDVVQCYKLISTHQAHVRMPLAMEVNLSCPNIPGHPPPAYSATALSSYLTALKSEIHNHGNTHVPIGIKTPPYTYHDQFHALITALRDSATAEPKHVPCPVSFITATNTLGSSLLLCSADATGIAATIASANGRTRGVAAASAGTGECIHD